MQERRLKLEEARFEADGKGGGHCQRPSNARSDGRHFETKDMAVSYVRH